MKQAARSHEQQTVAEGNREGAGIVQPLPLFIDRAYEQLLSSI
ncbi:hypothetical protein [Paenibacillus pinistramenti]|nr:hypothetical protein [Paenibacillus pinistramenti]